MNTGFPRIFALLPLLALVGCGSGSSTSTPAAGPAVRVTLVDGPEPSLKALRLRIERVEIHTSSSADNTGWLVLGEPKKTVDLLSLRNGVVETLVPGASVGAGQYQQLRLILGTPNEVVLADDSVQPLEVPSGLNTGIKVPLSFEAAPGTTKDLFLDFDGARSIQVHTTGAKDRYILRPVVRAVDRVVSGGITGTLTGPTGPLANALVLGQTSDTAGRLQVVRTVPTKADGTYVLDLLPLGVPVTVASLPLGMAPKASEPLTLSLTAPTATWSATFTAAATGTLSGPITPLPDANQSDRAEFLAKLGTRWVLVATAPVASATPYAFQASLPPGTYTVQVRRTTVGTDGALSTRLSQLSAEVTVTAGAPASVPVAF